MVNSRRWKIITSPPRTQTSSAETVTRRLGSLSVSENTGQDPLNTLTFRSVVPPNLSPNQSQKLIWRPKCYGSSSGVESSTVESQPTADSSKGRSSTILSNLFKEKLLENFNVDNSTHSFAQIRATFYPKFENEKSDQEVRTRMVEMVSQGRATLEVSLKHSGSLFMYSGNVGGAYAKNSYGNIYTAVGVFVLGRMFQNAWGTNACKKQKEFNEFIEKNRMCISMELVTAVLGDHGQRPREDYVVVTAVTEFGNGKPQFYSTPEIIAFCRGWRLPTNHVWLFSTRKSAASFFTMYDALCEEGTATTVCQALDRIADISVPGSKDHIQVQGEILEGLVARIVSRNSSEEIRQVLNDLPSPPSDGDSIDCGPGLREICASNKSNEKEQINALLQSIGPSFCSNHVDWFGPESNDSFSKNVDRSVLSKFLRADPSDFATKKLQEMIRLMKDKHLPTAFKCYHNFHKIDCTSKDNIHFKLVVHVHSDNAFRRYQNEMRRNPGLWPLYRGFFIDINLFNTGPNKCVEHEKGETISEKLSGSIGKSLKDGLADEDANLMVKLKFLTYKLRTFLIRNGLSILFKEGPSSYKAYYLKQMKIWGTSSKKQRDLSKLLDEWAVYIRKKLGHRQLSSSIYLSEAEPFLEQYAKRNPENQILIGSAGNFIRAEDFLAVIQGDADEEGDLAEAKGESPSSSSRKVKDILPKTNGMLIFFPGIPGCAKSKLCEKILEADGGLGDSRPISSLMGDLFKGKYWQKIADECRKRPNSIIVADKNAPNEEVWRQIETMCRTMKRSAVPVIPDSEGSNSNPFSIDALAVFVFRVLQRINHPGNLDEESPNAGYVLMMFYHLYNHKSRREFEAELIDRFGSLVKMPLLKTDRKPMPEPISSVMKEGISLFKLHSARHGRVDSSKGSYVPDWVKWESKLRKTIFDYSDYLISVQVPFEDVVSSTLEQLRTVAKGEFIVPDTEKRKLGVVVFAAINLPVPEVLKAIHDLANSYPEMKAFISEKEMERRLTKAHVTLAHKRSHGVTEVANYGMFLNREVPVALTSFIFSEKTAAFDTDIGCVDGEKISSKNKWAHVTVWTAEGVGAKEANLLPALVSQGKATRIEFKQHVSVTGKVEFF